MLQKNPNRKLGIFLIDLDINETRFVHDIASAKSDNISTKEYSRFHLSVGDKSFISGRWQSKGNLEQPV